MIGPPPNHRVTKYDRSRNVPEVRDEPDEQVAERTHVVCRPPIEGTSNAGAACRPNLVQPILPRRSQPDHLGTAIVRVTNPLDQTERLQMRDLPTDRGLIEAEPRHQIRCPDL